MGKELKPRTAAGYSTDITLACERTLLTLLSAFGNLKDTLRLVGGLVPRYLTPETPPDIPMHTGTSDVDIVINLEVLAIGDEYACLADQLKARGLAVWSRMENPPLGNGVDRSMSMSRWWLSCSGMQAINSREGR